ncbi:MAG: tRNA (adenine(22)-N(1))-methyltransferase TrmK, partial [Psychrobacillus sp.]
WNVDQETILEEHTKIYEVIVLKKGNMVLNEQELLLGPILMQSRTSVFQKKWSVEMKEWERILTQLKNIPPTPEVLQKVEEIENKISLVKELL